MRAFIGVEIPDNIREKLSQIQGKIEKLELNIKFVERENFHFCLKFLGDVSEEKIETIKDLLKEINFKKFSVKIKGLGVFPSKEYIRVLWVGVSDSENMVKLAEIIDKCLNKAGFKSEERKFKPHLTIGRIKSSKNKDKLINFLEKNSDAEIGEFNVNKVFLFQSILTQKGPIYKKIYGVSLNGHH